MDKPRLSVVIVSTRPNRTGPAIAQWFESEARAHGKHEVVLVDLAEENLPLLDEPNHPRLKQYTQEHTRRWSAKVEASDAFVFVMPEYNFSVAAPLVNAFDYLFHEWKYKPAGFVAYGGVSGGLRAVQAAKPLLTSLGVMPIPESVSIHGFPQQMAEGRFVPNEGNTKAANHMLDELFKWSTALKPLRA